MFRHLIRRFAICFFLLYLLAVTWPIATWFGSAEPFLFGLPFSMAWPVAWILLGWITLMVLEHFEQKGEDD